MMDAKISALRSWATRRPKGSPEHCAQGHHQGYRINHIGLKPLRVFNNRIAFAGITATDSAIQKTESDLKSRFVAISELALGLDQFEGRAKQY